MGAVRALFDFSPFEKCLNRVYLGRRILGNKVKLFKKQRKPEDLGALIYEVLRSAMETEGDLSITRLLQSLDVHPDYLDENYEGEIIAGVLFGAQMAITRSAPAAVGRRIFDGLKNEFMHHLREQGANEEERREWDEVIANRFEAYESCLDDYSGFEPPWRLGRRFFWNIITREAHVAMSIKIATLYLLAARDVSQNLLNEYGPTLVLQ